jgi:hypothetical protein
MNETITWYLLECAHYGYQQQGQSPPAAKDGNGGEEVVCQVCSRPDGGPQVRRRVVREMD